MPLIHTTAGNIEIHVDPGKKSANDFRVRYIGPHGLPRTPKHIHLIVEMYVKQAHNAPLTMQLRNHLLAVYNQVQPINQFPPALQIYQPGAAQPFLPLDAVGEFSVEFFLVVNELIFIQEKTNYPQGSLTEKLYADFGVKDRFAVVAAASWRG